MEFNKDILEIIFKNILTFKDSIKFRLIDKDCNEIFKYYFLNLKVDIIPRSTFINFSECGVCYHEIHYEYLFKSLVLLIIVYFMCPKNNENKLFFKCLLFNDYFFYRYVSIL